MAMMEWIRSKWVAEAPIPNAHATNSIFFFGISHYIWTIVAAILGGVLARAFFAATVVRRGEAEPDARGAARHPARSWLGVAIIATAIAVLLVSIVAIGSMSDVRLRAGGMFLLSCGLFGTTAVGALFGRGWRREMAVGVALFGAGYLYLAMSTERPFYFEQPIPTLQPRVTDQFLDAVRSLLPPASRGIDPADARILKAREQPISMRSFDEAPLEDVLKYVAMATSAPDYPGIPIYTPHGPR
jgi:hypothetical protein